MQRTTRLTRRGFLRLTGGVMASAGLWPRRGLGAAGWSAAGDRLGVAVIGLGDRGGQHLSSLLGLPETQVLAVCDPYRSKAEQWRARVEQHYGAALPGGHYRGCAASQDYREILARPDIDAVFIAAPEHWHALMSIGAVRAGKDVFCEKALSLTVAEGRAMCEAVRGYGRVLQVGTQQRSDRGFRQACELARNGHLGRIRTVKVSVPGGRSLPVAPSCDPPPDLDYELWLGPAPWTPYNEVKGTFNWYFISDYCAGWIQSWGVHHIDIALWGAPGLQQAELDIEGWATFPTEGLADTSIHWSVTAQPVKGGPTLEFTDDANGEHGVRFIGERGWVHVTRGGIRADPEELVETPLRPEDRRLPVSNHHVRDFLEAMRTRRDPVSPVESGHAATTLTLVADIATRLGRRLRWDWGAERFVGDAAGNALLSRANRSPWHW